LKRKQTEPIKDPLEKQIVMLESIRNDDLIHQCGLNSLIPKVVGYLCGLNVCSQVEDLLESLDFVEEVVKTLASDSTKEEL